MKLMKKCVLFLCIVSSSHGITSEEIKTEVGTGFANKALLSSSFTTEKGDTCAEHSFCQGSSLASIINPKSSRTYNDCGSNQRDCANFQVIAPFDDDLRVQSARVHSSDGPIEEQAIFIVSKHVHFSNIESFCFPQRPIKYYNGRLE